MCDSMILIWFKIQMILLEVQLNWLSIDLRLKNHFDTKKKRFSAKLPPKSTLNLKNKAFLQDLL